MVLIAACLYLPQHIAFLTNRAWFYYHGEDSAVAAAKVTPGVVGGGEQVAKVAAKAALEFAGRDGTRGEL